MISRYFRISLFLFLFIPTFIFSETDKCGEIKEEKGKLSCYKKEYERLDKTLNEVYQDIKKRIDKPLAEAMKRDSRSWIDRKEYFCADSLYTGDKEAESKNSSYYSCLIDFTDSRISYLKKAFGREGIKTGLVGEYNDGDNGSLTISKNKNQFDFYLNVVRGPTHHLGEISGSLDTKKKEFKWRDIKEGESCELNFKLSDYTIDIKEVECSSFHGARAYFDGIYRKIK